MLPLVFGQVGPWGLVTLAVVLVLTGRLVPRSAMQRERELLTQRAEDWKSAHGLVEQARAVQAEQLDEILTAVKAITPARAP